MVNNPFSKDMTSQTTTSLTKFSAAIVALALVTGSLFALAIQRAHAVTLSELVELFIALDIIQGDKAEQARAVVTQQETTGPSTGTGSYVCPATPFIGTMGQGASSMQVMELQKFLNSVPGISVSATGAGSVGMETMYYGPATKAAVTAYQNMYANAILTPLGLSAGTGFAGASTIAHINALCATPVVPPTPPTPGDGDDDDDDNGSPSMSTSEADIDGDYRVLSTPSNEDLEEGDEDEAVFGFEFEVADGDVIVNRIDVNFQGIVNSACTQGSGKVCESDPWRSFENVSLWLDGEKVADVDASRSSDWSRQSSGVYRLRFSGLDLPFYEGDNPEFTVAVTVRNTIDSQKLDQSWDVWVPQQGVRARDGAGLDQYTGAVTKTKFNIEALGSSGKLKARLDSSNPKASTIRVSDTSVTKDVTVLAFELEADDVAVLIRELPITLTTTGNNIQDLVDRMRVRIDGVTYDRFVDGSSADNDRVADLATTTGTTTLDLVDRDEEIQLDRGDKVLVEVVLDFKKATTTSGNTIKAEFTATNRDIASFELNNGLALASGDRTGTAIGEEHSLVSEGIFAQIVSTNATKSTINNGTEDVANFTFVMDITGFDDTFFIGSSTATAVQYRVERGGATVATTTTASLTSTATKELGNFRLDEGQPKRFTLQVSLDPDAGQTGFYRVVLEKIFFSANNTGTVNDQKYVVNPEEDFKTEEVNILQ